MKKILPAVFALSAIAVRADGGDIRCSGTECTEALRAVGIVTALIGVFALPQFVAPADYGSTFSPEGFGMALDVSSPDRYGLRLDLEKGPRLRSGWGMRTRLDGFNRSGRSEFSESARIFYKRAYPRSAFSVGTGPEVRWSVEDNSLFAGLSTSVGTEYLYDVWSLRSELYVLVSSRTPRFEFATEGLWRNRRGHRFGGGYALEYQARSTIHFLRLTLLTP